MPATASQLFDPETTLPELMPQGEMVPTPMPATTVTPSPAIESQYNPAAGPQHWTFSTAPTRPQTDREKAYNFITSGSEPAK
jgi:hypothetical protein